MSADNVARQSGILQGVNTCSASVSAQQLACTPGVLTFIAPAVAPLYPRLLYHAIQIPVDRQTEEQVGVEPSMAEYICGTDCQS